MNTVQRIVLAVAVIAILAVPAFTPPFYIGRDGLRFAVNPYQTAALAPRTDVPAVAVRWVAILLVAGLLVALTKSKKQV